LSKPGTTKADVIAAVVSISPRLTYGDLTVPALTLMCQAASLPTTGNKADLIGRLLPEAKPTTALTPEGQSVKMPCQMSSSDEQRPRLFQLVEQHYLPCGRRSYYYTVPRCVATGLAHIQVSSASKKLFCTPRGSMVTLQQLRRLCLCGVKCSHHWCETCMLGA
jgi:hypothetical protein